MIRLFSASGMVFALAVLSGAMAQETNSIGFTSHHLVPKGATVEIVKAGKPGPGVMGFKAHQTVKVFDAPTGLAGAGPFDLYLVPKTGRPVRLKSKWEPDRPHVWLKLGELIGAAQVRGDDLPRASKVILTDERDPGPGEKGHVPVQEVDDYKTNLLVPPGFYSVWIKPTNGVRYQKIADRIRIHAGKVTEVGD